MIAARIAACRPEWLCRLPGVPEGRLWRMAAVAPGSDHADLSGGAGWRHGVRTQGDRGRRMPDAVITRHLTGRPR